MKRPQRVRAAAAVGALLCAVSALGLLAQPAGAAGSKALVGTFHVTPGSCSGGTVTGSYIRMILPSGGGSGPFMSNSDSTCHDASYTLLRPGSDGGLVTGSYQSTPSPIFDAKGNARADRITAPAVFYGTGFATATSSRDPQTGASVPAPSINASGSTLTGDLRSFAVTWNNQYFNQGAPKPNGSFPGISHAVTGTYNASTGAYTLDWRSQVVGGPFDKFTGSWHLTGTFVPAHKGAPAPSSSRPTAAAGGVTHPSGSADTATGSQSPSVGVVGSSLPATSAATSGGASAVTGGQPSSSGPSAPISAHQLVSASTSVSHGWRAPVWLIVLIAVVAVVALYVLVSVQRSIIKAGRAG